MISYCIFGAHNQGLKWHSLCAFNLVDPNGYTPPQGNADPKAGPWFSATLTRRCYKIYRSWDVIWGQGLWSYELLQVITGALPPPTMHTIASIMFLRFIDVLNQTNISIKVIILPTHSSVCLLAKFPEEIISICVLISYFINDRDSASESILPS